MKYTLKKERCLRISILSRDNFRFYNPMIVHRRCTVRPWILPECLSHIYLLDS